MPPPSIRPLENAQKSILERFCAFSAICPENGFHNRRILRFWRRGGIWMPASERIAKAVVIRQGIGLVKIKRPSTQDLARMCAEGLTQAQIGRIFGVSHATIRTWIARDRDAFEKYFMTYHSKQLDKETERRAREIAKREAEL